MKKLMPVLFSGIALAILSGCKDSNERYLDLSTGQPVELKKSENTGLMVNSETGEPVFIYVDTRNNDTILGSTGKVINGHIVKLGEKKYVLDSDEKLKLDDDGSLKYKDGDYKVKIENDGDMKTKNDDRKVKVDGETDEKKIKNE